MMETDDKEKKLKFIRQAEIINKLINMLDDILGIEAENVSISSDKKVDRRQNAPAPLEIEQEL